MPAAAMDDDIFHAFRSVGMSEEIAAKLAKIIPRRDEVVTKADLDAEREADLDTKRKDREAEREADREHFAAGKDVAVLQSEMTDVKAAIVRIDKSIERIDKTFVSMREMIARSDERINGIRTVLLAIFVPLHLLTLTTMFGLLTRGILWAVAP
ncbi:MAG: hypothetical protein OXU62_11060 [Gammaproteobacteria bacterium]|nr:hypothetical protein [Gammaproteobacteria bacterium]